MPVNLDLDWWDKTKPMSLTGETVTVALRKVELARAALAAKPTRENLTQLSGALKALQTSFSQTKARCNKAFQGSAIKAITHADSVVQKAYNDLQGALARFTAELETYQKQRNILASALNLIFMRKRLDQVPGALKALDAFLVQVEQGKKDGRLAPDEYLAAVQSVAAAKSLLTEIERLLSSPDDAAAKLELNAKWAELGETAKKIGVLGGYLIQQAAATCYTLEI
jgi:hypothetical protein